MRDSMLTSYIQQSILLMFMVWTIATQIVRHGVKRICTHFSQKYIYQRLFLYTALPKLTDHNMELPTTVTACTKTTFTSQFASCIKSRNLAFGLYHKMKQNSIMNYLCLKIGFQRVANKKILLLIKLLTLK